MDLYDHYGHRKYITPREGACFLAAAQTVPQTEEVTTFCETLAYAGCRISEALQLSSDRVDIADEALIFRCLKKRGKVIYRAVPVPSPFITRLVRVHQIDPSAPGRPLWGWSRATAWRRVCEVMDAAGITGMRATPKGLRHGFGIRCITTGVPLHLLQRWMGHAQLSTSAIYANAIGPEERQLAARLWA